MTTVARRDSADKAKIDAIEKKLLANPEIAKLIDDLGVMSRDVVLAPARNDTVPIQEVSVQTACH